MFFNSFTYAVFLPLIFIIYWNINSHIKWQNVLLLVASYVFYGWWDYRFLSLIILSSFIDFNIGLRIFNETNVFKRKTLLILSLVANLGILLVFKYFNFFIDSFVDVFSTFNIQVNRVSLNIILPVGISFYTFQTLSYTIDVYRKNLEPTKNWIAFFSYVSFFPQLVAGPIERAKNLLPQFEVKKNFDLTKAKDGLRQILLGLLKKVIIADNCAVIVNTIFENPDNFNSGTLILGAIFFAFQIYGDFSGYSDIAIGSARLLGFDLMKNFNFPYFSRDIAEFWRRWHISLSTWFRDYLYIPLGGSRVGSFKKFRNVLIIFLVSGFWHGANWTFIFWGLLHALFFIPYLYFNLNRKNLDGIASNSLFPSFNEFIGILITFSFTCFAWIFFRAESISDAFLYIGRILDFNGLRPLYLSSLPMILIFLLLEWIQRKKDHAFQIEQLSHPIRWAIYYISIFILFYYHPNISPDFIYFQF